jgi:hypothetical protein
MNRQVRQDVCGSGPALPMVRAAIGEADLERVTDQWRDRPYGSRLDSVRKKAG